MATGLPPKVEACEPGFQSIISARGHADAERHARGNALRHAHNVRLDLTMLDSPPLAGTASARLYFVDDQQNTVTVTDLAQLLHKDLRRDHIATLALDRLNKDGSNFFRRECALEELVFNEAGRRPGQRHLLPGGLHYSRDRRRDSGHA